MSCIKSVRHSVGAKKYPAHSHENEHTLIYVRRGRVHLKLATREWLITRPSIIFLSNLEKHAIVSEGENYDRFSVAFEPSEALRRIDSAKLMSPFCDRPQGFANVLDVSEITPKLDMLFSLLLSEFEGEESEISDSAASVLRVILIALCRFAPDAFPYKSTERGEIVQNVRRMLESDLSNELPLDDIAASFHISTFYLAHIFKDITGYSVKNYRLLCRLSKARELLVGSDHSVKLICEQTGFPDMSNFSRRFKAEYGVTPTEFRNQSKIQPKKNGEIKKKIGVELL